MDKARLNPHFDRAKREILYLNGDIPQASEDFIPIVEEEKFEEQLRIESEENYCLYVLIKIYHYIEVFQGVKIQKMAGDFVKDDTGVIWLINTSRVIYEQLPINVREGLNFRDAGDFMRE